MEIEKLHSGSSVYFVGIKGTGVCALAELMRNTGIKVCGSDTGEKFYTDSILQEMRIPYYEDFDASRIEKNIDIVIHSAAYNKEKNPELARAWELGITVLKYTDALGEWSKKFDSTGVCGVHGKTTTTALCGVCARSQRLPAQILTGSAALDFGGRSTLHLGDKYFIAETCEYRRHFLSFHPKRIILTAVESDHQDFFPSYESIRDAFVEYCLLLPAGGQLIYCADDFGASEVASVIKKERSDIEFIPYGFSAEGDYKIHSYNVKNERAVFKLANTEFSLRVPGCHMALNAAAAVALTTTLVKTEGGTLDLESLKDALERFKSTKRRSEIIGEAQNIIFMDDYGHHPTAIKTTLAGIKSFYPARRLVVSFMPHTYSRTFALFEEFASCFNDADILFLHKVYASAREQIDESRAVAGGVDGEALYKKTAEARKKTGKDETYYIHEVDDSFKPICEKLKSGDIFITLGAGSNWPLGEKILECIKSYQKEIK